MRNLFIENRLTSTFKKIIVRSKDVGSGQSWNVRCSPRLFVNSGFTLIELLVVIAVLSILVTGLMTAINPLTQIQKARDSSRKSDLAQMQRALEIYYNDNNSYPPSAATAPYSTINGIVFGGDFSPYLKTLPKDPLSASNSYQYYRLDANTYYIYASLERPGDPQMCNNGNACTTAAAVGANCGGVCNYGVSSPNTKP